MDTQSFDIDCDVAWMHNKNITDTVIVFSHLVEQQLSTYKPHYQQWVIEQIRKGENYNSVTDAVDYYIAKIGDNRFQNLLQKYTSSPKNILSLSLDDIKTAQSDFEAAYNRLSRRERNKLKSNVLVDQPGLKIVKFEKSSPVDVDAAKALSVAAQNTKWCVCNVETAENYLKQGPLYLLTVCDRSLSNKFLCHIESNQLMDIYDKPKLFSEEFVVVISKYIIGFGIFCDNKMSNIYKGSIIHSPQLAYYYARDVIKGRWPQAEHTIMASEYANLYAREVIKGRWPQAEPYIIQNPVSAYSYARDVIKGRWPEAEPYIMQHPGWTYYYAHDVIKGRWLQAEPTMMENLEWVYQYARDVIDGRWSEAEPAIMQDSEWSYKYARFIIKGRWPEAESTIINNKLMICEYARDVIKGRWPEAESNILKDPRWAYSYARDVINGRWPEAEPHIMQDQQWASKYARDIINGRWTEAEPRIMQDQQWASKYARYVIQSAQHRCYSEEGET